MLAQSEAAQNPYGELEVVEEETAAGEGEKQASKKVAEEAHQTPSKDQDKNASPDKVADVVTAQMSPFKTPCKGPDDKSAAKEGRHSFLQSFTSDQQSMRKSLIENPYSSFISL